MIYFNRSTWNLHTWFIKKTITPNRTSTMESISETARIITIQNTLRMVAALQLTTYLWPPQAQIQDGSSFHYIIVGAGTAGCVIANRLTEDTGTNVLLVEAGGDPPLESDLPSLILLLKRSRFDWNYTAESDQFTEQCHQNPHFEMTQGKMLGGTSSTNYMIYGRGNRQGYESWASAAKDDTWMWENVLPYFNKIEKLKDPNILNSYGREGSMEMARDPGQVGNYLEAYKENGNNIDDKNGEQFLGYNSMMLTMSQGSRQSSARSYLTPIKNRPNLHVLKNTLVTKILFDDEKNAIGIIAATEDGKPITLKATKEVIVSAGVFNSPKLLLLSGIGPSDQLQNHNINCLSDLPVGQNLFDYISTTIFQNMETLHKPLPPKDPHEYPPIAAFEGFVSLNKAQKYPDYQTLSFVTQPGSALAFCSFFFRYTHEICTNAYKSGIGRIQSVNQIVNLNPKSRGKVLLRSSDPSDPPMIYPGYFSEAEDLENLIDYVEDYASIMNTTYLRSVSAEMPDPMNDRCSGFPWGSRDYWGCYVKCMMSGMSNYMGTCAMGSVVDGRLRVRGVQRLRVADASVIPTPNGGNPYSQVVMIGEKASDFIKNP